MVVLLVIGGTTLGAGLSAVQLPQMVTEKIASFGLPPLAVISLLCLMVLAMGSFLDVIAILIIMIPITIPLVMSLGYSPIWWGVVLNLACEVGLATPPVGVCLFVAKGITGMSLGDVAKGAAPFLCADLAALVLAVLFPELVMWLPNLIG